MPSTLSFFQQKAKQSHCKEHREKRKTRIHLHSTNPDQMARVVSSCAALMAQRRGISVAITAIEVSAKKVEEKAVKLGAAATATTTEDKTAFWEPDPETGDCRPVTGTKEVDPADMRAEIRRQRMLQQQ